MKILDVSSVKIGKTLEIYPAHTGKVLNVSTHEHRVLKLADVRDFSFHSEGTSQSTLVVLMSVVLLIIVGGGTVAYSQIQKNHARTAIENAGFMVGGDGLLLAAQQGDVNLIDSYSTLGIKAADVNGIIEYAILSGNPEMLSKVLSEGAKFDNEENASAFFPVVIESDNAEMLAALITGGAAPETGTFGKINITEKSATSGKWGIVKWVLQNKQKEDFVDGSGNSAAHYFVLSDSSEIIELASKLWQLDFVRATNNAGETPLHIAARMEKPISVYSLLKLGANSAQNDMAGVSPVQVAVASENDEVISSFVRGGGDAYKYISSSIDLEYMIKHKYAKTLLSLIDVGAVNVNSYLLSGETVLAAALLYKQSELAKVLIDKGADPNAPFVINGVENVTSLMIACINGDAEMVSLLISKGANRDSVASNGLTAQGAAQQGGNQNVIDLLAI